MTKISIQVNGAQGAGKTLLLTLLTDQLNLLNIPFKQFAFRTHEELEVDLDDAQRLAIATRLSHREMLRQPTAPASTELAQQQGFTGDACSHCGSMMMVRTGHCATCQACGQTTGCS